MHSLYQSADFKIKVSTNDRRALLLVDNYLDLPQKTKTKPRFTFDISIIVKSPSSKEASLLPHHVDSNENGLWQGNLCNPMARAKVNTPLGKSETVIYDFRPELKEQLLYFCFFKPLRLLALKHNLFCIHAAAVTRNRDCIIVSGPKHAGKTSFTMTFAKQGYQILCDDNCFIQAGPAGPLIYPLPTKPGVKMELLRSFPELKNLLVKDYTYGGKSRISVSDSYLQGSNHFERTTLLFPRYSKCSRFKVRRLSLEESISRLFKETPNVNGKRSISSLCAPFLTYYSLCSGAECFDVEYNERNLPTLAQQFAQN